MPGLKSRTFRNISKQKGTRTQTAFSFNKFKRGIPAPKEGENGDIQARLTNEGPMLFIKIAGAWYKNSLIKAVEDPAIYPKYHIISTSKGNGTTPASAGSVYHQLPSTITNENLLGIVFGYSTGTAWRSYFATGDHTVSIGSGHDLLVQYNERTNQIAIEAGGGSSAHNKDFTLLVLYS
jgi:hypothetical protein